MYATSAEIQSRILERDRLQRIGQEAQQPIAYKLESVETGRVYSNGWKQLTHTLYVYFSDILNPNGIRKVVYRPMTGVRE